ncbi:MAG: sigma-70 family RNA polymerase sigma factor [Candidatus Omnitrophica bacterium]|jgi:RNA polymerase sigma factor (sigma-70 family)|nr:sigma-70 family RNA polymerase sigma factor [Candidatus Omnitrophota bacterium]
MKDLEFIQRCIRSDGAAWDEFLRKYSRLIYNYIRSVLNIRGYAFRQHIVEDVFQEIIFSLIKDNFAKLRSFKGKNRCSFASWLRQVTVNYTIDHLRKPKAKLYSIDQANPDGLSFKEIICERGSLPAEALSKKETAASLIDCIQQLPAEDKYLLELNLNQGLSLNEIKEHLGVSRGALDMRRSRIIQRLKDCFVGKGFAFEMNLSEL